jgi:hypothetical protein
MEKKPVHKTSSLQNAEMKSCGVSKHGEKNRIQNQTLGNRKMEPLQDKYDKLNIHQYGQCYMDSF